MMTDNQDQQDAYVFTEEEIDRFEIAPHLLAIIPESFAQKAATFLISFESNELHILTYPRPDHELDELKDALRFATGMEVGVKFSFAEKYVLNYTIERHYKTATAMIENCDLKFKVRCPKRWLDLTATETNDIRFCSVCQRNVFLCDNQYEAKALAEEGKCIAVIDLKYGNGFLIGSLVGDGDDEY